MIQIKKISILLAIFFIIGCSLTAISANSDITDTIAINEENNYNNLEKVSTATNFTTLQQEINENDEITLNNNVTMLKEEQGNFSNGIVINKTIAIDGNGYTIDANSLGRIFQITNNESVLTLKNITLMNGNSTGDGGAIYGNGDINLNCDNVSFVNNTAIRKPGGIIFSDSSIYSDGGSIYSGGLVCINGGTINFVNNTANAGGAIYASSVVINATNVSFVNNIAKCGGGAIYSSKGVVINASSVSFINNDANTEILYINSKGGAIYSDEVVSINSDNVSFINNIAVGYGGAIYASSLVVNATNVNFANNKIYAIKGNTGGSSFGGAISASTVVINATNVNFNNNIACDGGAIYASSVVINATNVSFVKNEANHYIHGKGGAICSSIVNINSDSVNFVNNIGNCPSWFTAYGGSAIYSNNDVVINTSSLSIINNTNYNGDGGAIYSDSEIKLYVNDLTGINNSINESYFIINHTSFYSSFYTNSSTVMINDDLFENSLFGQSYRYLGNILLTVNDLTKYYGDNEQLTAILIKDAKRIANETITFTINGREYNRTTDENGTARMDINLNSGIYTVTASYNNNSVVYRCDATVTILSIAPTVNVTGRLASGLGYYSVTVTLPSDATGNVTLFINNITKNGTLDNGTITFYFTGVNPRENNVTVNYTGDNNYNASIWNKTINFLEDFKLTLENLTKYYNDTTKQLIAILTLNGKVLENKTITFTINGREYNRTTDENGTARMNINLNSGIYTVKASYNNSFDVFTSDAIVTVLTTINASDLVKIYRNASQFYVTFLNQNKIALSDTNVTFNINGVWYTRTTNNNGTAKLNINLDSGKYVLTAINPVTKENKGFNITVLSTVKSNDIIKFYRNGTQYIANFTAINGSALDNINVKFNINGVFYTKTTDNNGTAILNINLQPGKYVLTAINPITNETIGSNVTVQSVLVGEDLNKSYSEEKSYELKVIDGQGNILANQTVQMNIHGVIYNKTTDSNGIARLAIHLEVGDYIITTTWNGTFISNKISISNTTEQNNTGKQESTPINYPPGVASSTIYCRDCEGQLAYSTKLGMFGVFYDNDTNVFWVPRDLGLNLGESTLFGSCSHSKGVVLELWDLPILDFYSGWFVSDDAYDSFIYKSMHSLKDNSTSLENKTLNDIDWDKWVNLTYDSSNSTDNDTADIQNVSIKTCQHGYVVGPCDLHTIICRDCGGDVYRTFAWISIGINNNNNIIIIDIPDDLGLNHTSFDTSLINERSACSHHNNSLNISLFDIPILDFYHGWFVSDDAYNSFIYKATHSLKDNSTSLENKTLQDIDWEKWYLLEHSLDN